MLRKLCSRLNSLLAKYKAYRDRKRYQKALDDLDRFMDSTFQTCFMLFRPSFYVTHTPEEIEKATKESLERINKLLEELD